MVVVRLGQEAAFFRFALSAGVSCARDTFSLKELVTLLEKKKKKKSPVLFPPGFKDFCWGGKRY